MRKNLYLLLLIYFTYISDSKAQPKYYSVQLIDKKGTPFSLNHPEAFLSSKTIERRLKYNIAIDSTDLPCAPAYVESIKTVGSVSVMYTSKWFNRVTINTDDENAIAVIKNFPFVSNVSLIATPTYNLLNKISGLTAYHQPAKVATPKKVLSGQSVNDLYMYGQSFDQIHLHNGEFLHNHGFTGEGLQICITDGGFFQYQTSPAFDSVRDNNQILDTWDFVENDISVNEDNVHGSYCFSTIAANIPGIFVGAAPKASFYLYRTEDDLSEMPVEEQNWIAAVEKAESLGADIVSVSIGYTTFDDPLLNHAYVDMNGNTAHISIAADMAAKKGMIIVTSAGNLGNSPWHFIAAPADGDSVLAIGAVNKFGQVANFSSYGPSSDGQVKPDAASVGLNAIVVHPTNGQPFASNGTSFACPNLAGLATCLWQAFPEVNNMAIINAIQQSSDRFNNPNDRTGYGIPDMKKAYVLLVKKLYTQNITSNNCKVDISFDVKSDTGTTFIIERKLSTENNYNIINTQKGTGSFDMNNFAYTDNLGNAATGMIKYRIKMQVSADTTFYLDSTSISFDQACNSSTKEKIIISPNPVIDELNISITKNNPITVEILIQTSVGQKIYYVKKQQNNNNEEYTIPFKKFSKGIYFVTVFINGRKEQTKKILYH